jgi:integrase
MARFVDVNGNRRNRSTQSTNRKEAQKIADAYEAATRKRRTAKQVRDVITELQQEITGEELPSQSFRAFAEAWLDRKKPEVYDATWVFYKKTVRKFTAFLSTKADLEMIEITFADVLQFRNEGAKTLTTRTVNYDLKCLRMIFKAARQERIVSEDPSEFVSTTKKAAPKVRRPFTIVELQSVMAIADDEWKSMIRFGLYTGQRLGDIARLKWGNVDLEKGEIRLVAQKTNKPLVLPIAAPLKQHLESLLAHSGRDEPVHARAFTIVGKSGSAKEGVAYQGCSQSRACCSS